MAISPLLVVGVTFLLVIPPVAYVQIRRGAIPRRRWALAAGTWFGVFCVTLLEYAGAPGSSAAEHGAVALDGVALVAGLASLALLDTYRRARRRAGVA